MDTSTDDLVTDYERERQRLRDLERQPGVRQYRLQEQRRLVARLVEVVELGLERDMAQAERPAGCWCFGLGGRHEAGVPLQGGGIGTTFLEVCDACPEGQQEGRKKSELFRLYRQHHDALPESAWAAVGVPVLWADFRLDTSPPAQKDSELLKRLREYQGWWYFWGDVGRGKTGLAVGYAWEWMQYHRQPALFRSAPAVFGELRSTYNRTDGPTEQEVMARYLTVPLLVVDDLGTEQIRGTGWVEDRLYQIVNTRYSEGLATVFTSNLSLQDLGGRLGETMGARIGWRIHEACGKGHVVEVVGPNLRL